MKPVSVLHLINPWLARRERQAAQLAALRARDGDGCARCRRPMRFDLPAGHDQGPAIEPVVPGERTARLATEQLRLCHLRCSPGGIDHTGEVRARVRQKSEAALFAKARASRAA